MMNKNTLFIKQMVCHKDERIKVYMTMSMHRPLAGTWTELDRNHAAGSTELHIKDDPAALGWRLGERVGVATTSR